MIEILARSGGCRGTMWQAFCPSCLFERQALSVPSVGSATQHRDVLQASGEKLRRCQGRAPIGFADQHDWLAAGDEVSSPAGEIVQGNVDRARQVARRGYEFLGLAHIDEDKIIAGSEAALQLRDLDPCRCIDAAVTK